MGSSASEKHNLPIIYYEKFKVQSSRFKVKRKGRHELFMLYG
jgi:hypothetical protein